MADTKRITHTPGPWAVQRDGYGVYYVNPRIEAGEDIDDPQHDSVICRVDGAAFDAALTGVPDDAMLANARLIAAAPRMLEALREMLEAQVCGPCVVCENARAILRDVDGQS